MAETIIFLVISLIVSLIFVILGIMQYKSEVPVALNTGETPPREDELTDMLEWNHKHGRNLIIFGCELFTTLTIFIFVLGKFDNVLVQVFFVFAALFGEIAWVEIQHNNLKKNLIKKY